MKLFKNTYAKMGAAMTAGMIAGAPGLAFAGAGAKNDFSKISENVATSIGSVPGLLSGLAYLFGILLAILGIFKIKEHVENPGQNPLKDGMIRLCAGGALFALPMVTDAMFNTVDSGGKAADVATVNKVKLGV